MFLSRLSNPACVSDSHVSTLQVYSRRSSGLMIDGRWVLKQNLLRPSCPSRFFLIHKSLFSESEFVWTWKGEVCVCMCGGKMDTKSPWERELLCVRLPAWVVTGSARVTCARGVSRAISQAAEFFLKHTFTHNHTQPYTHTHTGERRRQQPDLR